MKYIIAVSGGVDSVVLLDMMSNNPKYKPTELIVAHFDHGIREESADDAKFVGELAAGYGLKFESKREELGAKASEALARQRRYKFLHQLADKYQAKIVTAHHLDDLVETVAINITRGTGWRGLAPFHSPIERPLINKTKQELIDYAHQHQLSWHEDSTNASDAYLRNRLRTKTLNLPLDTKLQLLALHARQKQLRGEVSNDINQLLGDQPRYDRHLLIQLPVEVSLELLRTITQHQLTRPQLKRLLHAVKTNRGGTKYEAGMGIKLHFTTRYFSL